MVVRDGRTAWEPSTGQSVLDFDVKTMAAQVAPMARRAADAARASRRRLTAEEWFNLGVDLEPHDGRAARDAYHHALELDPGLVDALVNLGRLAHEEGDVAAAIDHYRRALTAHPRSATAAFNLGVALEDQGRAEEAARAYEEVLRLDASHADAHFNLSRLMEESGRKAAAIQHLAAYRRLTRK